MTSGAVNYSTQGSWFSQYGWSRALQHLKKVQGLELPEATANLLVRGWGDDGPTVSPLFLAQLFRAAASATGTIIEFGAGASTVAIAWACRDRPASVMAIEHEPERRYRVLSALARLSRRSGDVRLATLETRDGLTWPLLDLHLVRRPIAFVVCNRIEGMGDPRQAWERLIKPSLPDSCPVYFDPN